VQKDPVARITSKSARSVFVQEASNGVNHSLRSDCLALTHRARGTQYAAMFPSNLHTKTSYDLNYFIADEISIS